MAAYTAMAARVDAAEAENMELKSGQAAMAARVDGLEAENTELANGQVSPLICVAALAGPQSCAHPHPHPHRPCPRTRIRTRTFTRVPFQRFCSDLCHR